MIEVAIPSQLRSYTDGAAHVSATGATVAAVFDDLDRRFPGLRFRVIDEQGAIRPHMRVFLNGALVRRIDIAASAGAKVQVFGALSGG